MRYFIISILLGFLVGATLGASFTDMETTFVHNPYESSVRFDEIQGYRIAIYKDGCAMITNEMDCKLRKE